MSLTRGIRYISAEEFFNKEDVHFQRLIKWLDLTEDEVDKILIGVSSVGSHGTNYERYLELLNVIGYKIDSERYDRFVDLGMLGDFIANGEYAFFFKGTGKFIDVDYTQNVEGKNWLMGFDFAHGGEFIVPASDDNSFETAVEDLYAWNEEIFNAYTIRQAGSPMY